MTRFPGIRLNPDEIAERSCSPSPAAAVIYANPLSVFLHFSTDYSPVLEFRSEIFDSKILPTWESQRQRLALVPPVRIL